MKPDLSDLASQCIRCGFCLESCPTFVETGNEAESPRGRIYLVRSALQGEADWMEEAAPHLEGCLGCRACETACPSGVEYGAILELAREKLAQPAARKTFINLLTHPVAGPLQVAASSLLPGDRIPGPLSLLLSGQAPEAAPPEPQTLAPWPDIPSRQLPAVRGEVYLLEGCVMRTLFPRVHQATRRLLRRAGFVVKEVDGGCCGALHAHAGMLTEAERRAQSLARRFSEPLPIVVNSAGCGSTMKEYGHVAGQGLGDLAGRVADISEFLLRHGLTELLARSGGVKALAVYHDACHLAHGQKIKDPPRRLLEAVPGLDLTHLPESDMCCGSAGTYNLFQPAMARRLLDRKWRNIASTGAEMVIQGNPGCHAWIAQAAREAGGATSVWHTAEVLESSFSGLPPKE